jgi:hypothetical protein
LIQYYRDKIYTNGNFSPHIDLTRSHQNEITSSDFNHIPMKYLWISKFAFFVKICNKSQVASVNDILRLNNNGFILNFLLKQAFHLISGEINIHLDCFDISINTCYKNIKKSFTILFYAISFHLKFEVPKIRSK